jgi:hypothetical protein
MLPVLLFVSACALDDAPVAHPDRGDTVCPRGPAPILSIAIAAPPPRRDDSLSLDQLGRSDDAAYGKVALGATTSDFRIGTQLAVIAAPSLGTGFCAYLNRITVTLEISNRIVHVAREFRDEACIRGEVAAHEQRHVALDDRLLVEERDRLAAELPTMLLADGIVWAADKTAAERNLTDRIVAIDNKENVQFALRRRLAHATEIDTPAEARHAGEMCGGRVAQILAASRRR